MEVKTADELAALCEQIADASNKAVASLTDLRILYGDKLHDEEQKNKVNKLLFLGKRLKPTIAAYSQLRDYLSQSSPFNAEDTIKGINADGEYDKELADAQEKTLDSIGAYIDLYHNELRGVMGEWND